MQCSWPGVGCWPGVPYPKGRCLFAPIKSCSPPQRRRASRSSIRPRNLDDLLDHPSMYLGKPLLAALVQVTQLVLAEPELVQDGGVDVAQV